MDKVDTWLDILKGAAISTLSQLVGLLGFFLIFGFVLFFLAKLTRNTFVKTIGEKFDIYVTGWIGTPVHELGHAVFCILFRHKIEDIKLFKPDPKSGTLGFVNHSFDKNSYYQKIGNFFIGIGPIILGSLVLYGALYYLIPNFDEVFDIINLQNLSMDSMLTMAGVQETFWILVDTGKATLNAIFTSSNMELVSFWVFIYVSMSVASHMELSAADLKGAASGAWTMIALLFVANLIAIIFGYDINQYVVKAGQYTGMFIGLFVFATIISATYFVFAYAVLSILTFIKDRKLVNPLF